MPTLTITLSNVGTMTFKDDKNVEIISVLNGDRDLTEHCIGDRFIPAIEPTDSSFSDASRSLTLGGIQIFHLGYNSEKKRLSWKIAQDVNVQVKIKADASANI